MSGGLRYDMIAASSWAALVAQDLVMHWCPQFPNSVTGGGEGREKRASFADYARQTRVTAWETQRRRHGGRLTRRIRAHRNVDYVGMAPCRSTHPVLS